MSTTDIKLILKRFDKPDEVRTFPKGRFEIVRLANMTIGRATTSPAGSGANMSGVQSVRHIAT